MSNMPGPKITIGDLEEGTAYFPDWQSLVPYMMQDTGDSGYVWRGQRDAAWDLVSSLERSFTASKVIDGERDDREQRALSYFRAHAAGYLGWTPPENDIVSWLVTMQHYGCPTRLLDWTESPFVAVYFAYCDMPENQTKPAALWKYDARLAMNALQRQPDDTGLEFPRPRDSGTLADSWSDELNTLVRSHIGAKSSIPLPISPVRPDARMTAQQTILTVDACLEGGVPYPLRTPTHLPLVFKVNLPTEWRREVLRALALMGITAASLFPDTAGVAQHAARVIQDGFRYVRSEVEGH
jgi:hypothetical protein